MKLDAKIVLIVFILVVMTPLVFAGEVQPTTFWSQNGNSLLNGQPIPPVGTPFAPPVHTQVHIEFLKSDMMKQANSELYQKLVVHIMGEMKAIEQRGGGQPAQTGQPGGAGVIPGASMRQLRRGDLEPDIETGDSETFDRHHRLVADGGAQVARRRGHARAADPDRLPCRAA